MPNSENFRQIAENCRKAAISTTSPVTRDALNEMAIEYDLKVEEAEQIALNRPIIRAV